jgi:hypothetical protein
MRRKVLTLLALGFALFFIITSPVEAAELVRGTVEVARTVITDIAQALATFVRTLM